MKQRWTDDELLQDFTLHPDELSLLTSTTDSNRLGFAVLLKYFKYEGRFPQNPSSIPTEIIGYIAQQIDVQPEALAGYDFGGHSIREHRARIRQWLSFRPYVETDRQLLIDWLCEIVLPECSLSIGNFTRIVLVPPMHRHRGDNPLEQQIDQEDDE